jgi:glutathione reductase (NADPH)
MAFDVDFFVIGAGSGGVRAARIAAGHGARTIVAEESRIGGTCVIRGCVPKKLYVYASRFADEFADAAGFGWRVGGTTFDWPSLVAAKEKEITRLSAAYRANLKASGAELIEERATIVGPQRVRLAGGRELSARHVLVAAGSRPTLPPGLEGVEHTITSNEAFDLTVFPKRLLVVGGGYIAVEFASLFQRLGAEVTEVLRGPNVLRGFDEDMRGGVRDAMIRAGVAFRFGVSPTQIEKRADGALTVTLSDGTALEVDQVLVATGRHPYTEGLGLGSVGVTLTPLGGIVVDSHLTSSAPWLHAVGDVSNHVNLTPVAIREGHVEAEAKVRLEKFDIYEANFRPMKATLSGSGERAIMKLIVDAKTQKVLGAHILAENAGEMIQLIAVAMTLGATKADFDATMAVHPTAAEELVTMRAPSRRYDGGEWMA